ncbi:ParB/RepB/Spo0J family partition protein [Mycobacteroides abscessus]|uniref:ParB/RepB/Spo0J family partition protein n=1 Tax=Mycobacteroides abscessus TaxID=36809 RepID=UPI00232A8DA4|nr:ParB/RepB/Spo0J family partition protein [Mycobacteroides abscessus]MDB2222335.1 ParB/RepB/Spo0J family partition protein [Mycobacteroides abscessus subsp. abscessus]
MSTAGYQVMPRLAADEYAELEQSIIENGVQVPITVAPNGAIVDGHHRDEIARKHRLHCPRVTADGDETKLRGLAFSLNLHRRHLSRGQKRLLVAESIKADPQLSDREHGRRTGVSDKTAAAVRNELQESAEIPHFSERIDPRTGNASQPASKPPRREPEYRSGSTEPDRSGLARDQDSLGSMDPNGNRPCRDCDGNGCETCLPEDEPATDEQIAVMAEMSDDEFEAALAAARADGDLSAGNVIKHGQQADDLQADEVPQRKSPEPPITKSFSTANYRLTLAVKAVVRLSENDRFKKNKDQISGCHLSDLIRARDALTGVIQQLEG